MKERIYYPLLPTQLKSEALPQSLSNLKLYLFFHYDSDCYAPLKSSIPGSSCWILTNTRLVGSFVWLAFIH